MHDLSGSILFRLRECIQVICICSSDGSGSKIFDPGWVGSDHPSMVWVRKIFPKIVKFFNFFTFGSKKISSKSTRVKGGSASYLLWIKSKLGSGQGPSLICSQQVQSIFINELSLGHQRPIFWQFLEHEKVKNSWIIFNNLNLKPALIAGLLKWKDVLEKIDFTINDLSPWR